MRACEIVQSSGSKIFGFLLKPNVFSLMYCSIIILLYKNSVN